MTSPAQAFAALHKLTPAEAVAYLAGRKQITPTYGWQDMWQQEHAQAFTVSRLTRADLMQSLQEQITKSVNGEMSRRDFQRDAKKLLSDAGWWGEKEVTDPVTGEVMTTTFDPARLKLIFDTNTSMAYAAGQWERIQSTKRSHPYVRYISMDDDRVRPAHRAWHGVTLPVDDAFWQTHYPPNGWRCRCRAVAVSQRDYDKGIFSSRPNAENDVNAPVVQTPMKKTAPDVVMRDWLDKRSGQVRSIPAGIDPGFGYNPGMARTSAQQSVVDDKLVKLAAPLGAAMMKELGPVLLAERSAAYRQWLSALDSDAKAKSVMPIIGAIDSVDLQWLTDNNKLLPRSAEIAISSAPINGPKGLRHINDGDALSAQAWENLPELIAEPLAVLYDVKHQTMLYVLPEVSSRKPQLIVEFDFARKDQRNMVISGYRPLLHHIQQRITDKSLILMRGTLGMDEVVK